MLLFISAILTFVWRTGSVLDPPKRDPLGARAALGPRITITGVFVLGLVYLGMIVRTPSLRNHGSYQNSSRTSPPLDTRMGARNDFGEAVDKLEASGAKRPRARDIDAAMERRGLERRGRERKRSASSQVRQREER